MWKQKWDFDPLGRKRKNGEYVPKNRQKEVTESNTVGETAKLKSGGCNKVVNLWIYRERWQC